MRHSCATLSRVVAMPAQAKLCAIACACWRNVKSIGKRSLLHCVRTSARVSRADQLLQPTTFLIGWRKDTRLKAVSNGSQFRACRSADIEEIGDYIQAENPAAARRLIAALRVRCDTILDAPRGGAPSSGPGCVPSRSRDMSSFIPSRATTCVLSASCTAHATSRAFSMKRKMPWIVEAYTPTISVKPRAPRGSRSPEYPAPRS